MDVPGRSAFNLSANFTKLVWDSYKILVAHDTDIGIVWSGHFNQYFREVLGEQFYDWCDCTL